MVRWSGRGRSTSATSSACPRVREAAGRGRARCCVLPEPWRPLAWCFSLMPPALGEGRCLPYNRLHPVCAPGSKLSLALRGGKAAARHSPIPQPGCARAVKAWVRYAKFEMKSAGDVAAARACYERAIEELGEDANNVGGWLPCSAGCRWGRGTCWASWRSFPCSPAPWLAAPICPPSALGTDHAGCGGPQCSPHCLLRYSPALPPPSPPPLLQEELFMRFAEFEEKVKEVERARWVAAPRCCGGCCCCCGGGCCFCCCCSAVLLPPAPFGRRCRPRAAIHTPARGNPGAARPLSCSAEHRPEHTACTPSHTHTHLPQPPPPPLSPPQRHLQVRAGPPAQEPGGRAVPPVCAV